MGTGKQFDERRGRYDLVIVGAGIVGLGHAYEAHLRGLTVAVIDRAATISGATVRNFGHVGVTAQSGMALEYAEATRLRWKRLAVEADFWLGAAGCIVVARADDEYALLEEFAASRDAGTAVLLSAAKIAECSPVAEKNVGGAWLTRDLQVDPRTAAAHIATWLSGVGVDFFWSTAVLSVDGTTVQTARGDVAAGAVIVAVGHDVDGLYPDVAADAGLERCALDMVSARAKLRTDLETPLLTGWSMVRYSGMAGLPSAGAVRDRLHREHPELAALDLNQMYTQRPNGDVIIGDSHAITASPFQREDWVDRILALARTLFGVERLEVRERWQGVYAKARDEFLVARPSSTVTIVSVTTGIGMSTGLGLAAATIDEQYGSARKGFAA